ncbi:MAG TPA: hypothetical protein VN541_09400, partial [Tepidisphaeraceae bacterium]|nr:hypothetical protein [Tepidisphaeraceae bacterium]
HNEDDRTRIGYELSSGIRRLRPEKPAADLLSSVASPARGSFATDADSGGGNPPGSAAHANHSVSNFFPP